MSTPPSGETASGGETGASPGAATDRLLDGRVALRQPRAGYRVAIDPVLLAAFAPLRPGERLLDLGCGVGAAALCALARVSGSAAVGLEIQAPLAALARGNAALNDMAGRFAVVRGDILRPPFPADGRFDHVLCNPPYQKAGQGRPPTSELAAVANVEGAAKLSDWIGAALRLVRPRGSITLVHRADRLDEILAALSGRAGAIVICPVHPTVGVDAKRVLVRARPAIATPTRLAAPFVLHEPDGGDTAAARAVLRGGAAVER
jgi:tRNA1(Val) A37 N6-methylase TrmN6